jgi:hypothetical protein
VATTETAPAFDYTKPGAWAQGILASIGAPYDTNTSDGARNVAFLEAWKRAEGTKAANNPLATTLVTPASVGDFNDAGVQEYSSAAAGVQATARTLLAGYPNVVRSLRSGDPGGIVTTKGGLSDLNRWVSGKSSPASSSYTDTISSLFFSLIGEGKSAYSGLGVGNFPVGHTTPADAAGAAAHRVADATGLTAIAEIAQNFARVVGTLLNPDTWRRTGLAVLGLVMMLAGGFVIALGAITALGELLRGLDRVRMATTTAEELERLPTTDEGESA